MGANSRAARTVFHAARHALLTKAPPAACSFAHAAFASATLLAHVLSPTNLSPPSVFPSTIPIFAIRSSRDLAYPPISRQPRRSCDAREKPPVARRIHPNLAEKESQLVHAPAMRAATERSNLAPTARRCSARVRAALCHSRRLRERKADVVRPRPVATRSSR